MDADTLKAMVKAGTPANQLCAALVQYILDLPANDELGDLIDALDVRLTAAEEDIDVAELAIGAAEDVSTALALRVDDAEADILDHESRITALEPP